MGKDITEFTGFRVTYSHTSQVDRFASYEEAVEAVRSVYHSAAIGHDGDISEGGDQTMVWGSESAQDDGTQAVCSIWAVRA